ncbi:hypothetical protein KJ068_06800 [bacterium]|nr:hypothetical protein [bacterium]
MATNNRKTPRYQWPASGLTPEEMAILYHLRERTGTPINKLLKEAVRKLGEALKPSADDSSTLPSPPEAAEP